MSEWISIEDRIPKAKQIVLFVCKRHAQVCMGYKDNNDIDSNLWWDESATDVDGHASDEYDVTHWMPLPEPPCDSN